MTILAVDSASEYASVAIRAHGGTLAEVSIHSRDGFAHLLFEAIEKCRNEAGIGLGQVDCFAAGSGPGSFTGVRIALSAVKGLAESMNKPATAISNLRALSAFGKQPGSKRAVLIDARRCEVYGGVYDSDLCLVVPETVGPLNDFLDSLGDWKDYEFIASAGLSLPTSFMEAPTALASAIARVAERDRQWTQPAELDANYVRRSDAELFWTDK